MSEPKLKPRNLDREAMGFVETPEGPSFTIGMNIHIPIRKMLADIPDQAITRLIREAEAELGRRGEKYR
jgi:hypothetical protein